MPTVKAVVFGGVEDELHRPLRHVVPDAEVAREDLADDRPDAAHAGDEGRGLRVEGALALHPIRVPVDEDVVFLGAVLVDLPTAAEGVVRLASLWTRLRSFLRPIRRRSGRARFRRFHWRRSCGIGIIDYSL